MAKEKLVEFEGVVVECLPNTLFKIELDNGHEIMGNLSGKMRKNNIRVLLGDRILIEVSPYDFTKGRIIFRYK